MNDLVSDLVERFAWLGIALSFALLVWMAKRTLSGQVHALELGADTPRRSDVLMSYPAGRMGAGRYR